jgi:hypothetical protein
MKIYTKIVLDKDNNIIEEQSYDYTGPIAHCGNGGEDGSAGSSAQEAANFDDYNTGTSQGRQDAESQYGSGSTGSYSYSDSGSDNSTGFEGSPEMGGSKTDTSGPSYDTSYDAGGADPAVPGDYRAGIGKTDYFNPNDTATSYSNNLKAEVDANPITALVAPLGTLGKVAIQTGMMRSQLGLSVVPGVTGGSGGSSTVQDSGSDSDNNVNVVRQVNVQGTGLPEPSSFITQTSFPNTNLTVQLYNQVKGLLSTPTQLGLLAVNESPFYDFLKTRNLDRRVL